MAENYIDLKFIADTAPLERAEKVADRLEKRINKLVAQEAKGRITTAQYSAAVGEMASSLQRAAGGSIQARNSVYSYSRAVYQAAEESRQFAAAAQMSQKAVHRKGVVMQQVGYQAGDFIVQIQSGTNAFVAFGQQATQLVGVLGMLNPKLIGLSAALSILIPLGTAIAAAYMRMNEGSKDAVKGVDALQDSITHLERALELISKPISEVKKQFGSLAQSAIQNATLILSTEIAISKNRLRTELDAMQGIFKDYSLASSLGGAFSRGVEELRTQFGDAALDANKLQEIFNSIVDTTASLPERAKGLSELQKFFSEAGIELDKIPQGLLYAMREAGLLNEQMLLLTNLTEEASKATDSAGGAVRNYTQNLTEAKNEAIQLRDIMNSLASARLGESDQIAVLRAKIAAARAGTSVQGAGAAAETAITLGRAGASADQIAAAAQAAGALAEERSRLEGILSDLTSKGGGKKDKQTVDGYLRGLMEEALYKQQLIGLSEQEARIQEIIFQAKQKDLFVTQEQASAIAAVEEQTRKLIDAEQRRKSMMETIEGHITNGFMAMIDGSSSVENAFKSMLRNILLDIYRQQVAEPAAKGIMGVVKKVFGFADGGAFSSGRVIPFANGGVVTGPTTFPMPGATGLMGEAGPEAIMPLKRGPNGKLGVEASGGQQVVVNQSFNFAANGDESVKKIIAQAAPQIAQMTQKQIMDSRRRGGQMKAAFS